MHQFISWPHTPCLYQARIKFSEAALFHIPNDVRESGGKGDIHMWRRFLTSGYHCDSLLDQGSVVVLK